MYIWAKTVSLCAFLSLILSPVLARAQDAYSSNWFNRVDRTQAEQPHWMTPIATPSSLRPSLTEKDLVTSLLKGHSPLGFPPAIPTCSAAATPGTMLSNTTFSGNSGREVELNSTFFQQGKNDGKKQNFVTPGL